LGKYSVTFDVREWDTTNNTEAFFAAGKGGKVGPVELQQLFIPVLDKLDAASAIDWQDGYVDEFGRLNHLVVIHNGIDGRYAGMQSCLKTSWQDRITSLGVANSSGGWVSSDSYKVNGWMITSAYGRPRCRMPRLVMF
jgi:hypothetical protein